MKKTKIIMAFFISILFSFSSCNFLNQPIESYLKKYTNEITVGTIEPVTSFYTYSNQQFIRSDSTNGATFQIFIANPQNHEFLIEELINNTPQEVGIGEPSEAPNVYINMDYDYDPTITYLTFSQEYLIEKDKEPEGNRHISRTFQFKDQENGQTFTPFKIEFTVNTPPQIFKSYPVIKKSDTNYILCMNFDNLTNSIFDDYGISDGTIKYMPIVIDGITYYFTQNSSGTKTFYESDKTTTTSKFSQTAPTNFYTIRYDFTPSSNSNNVVYFTSDSLPSTAQDANTPDKDITIKVYDKYNLFTDYTISTRPSSQEQLAPPTVTIDDDGKVTITSNPETVTGFPVNSEIEIMYSTSDISTSSFTGNSYSFYLSGGTTTNITAWQISYGFNDSEHTTPQSKTLPLNMYVDPNCENDFGGCDIDHPIKDFQQALNIIKEKTNDSEWNVYLLNDLTTPDGYTNNYLLTLDSTRTKTQTQRTITNPLKIKIQSYQQPNATTPTIYKIDGNSKCGILKVLYHVKLSLENIEITNAYNYGGIYYVGSSILNLKNCKITNNSTNENGGGVYLNTSSTSSSTFEQTTFSYNKANFTGNTNNGFGGGIYFNGDSTINLTNCTINNNEAYRSGGGVYYISNSTTHSIFKQTTFSYNKANYTENINYGFGGGIYSNGNLTLTACDLCYNESSNSGGAIYSCGHNLTINRNASSQQKSNLYNNKASYCGGAIYFADTTSKDEDFKVLYTNIYYNEANYGGGIYCSQSTTSSSFNIQYSEIFSNKAKTATGNGGGVFLDMYSNTASISDSNIYGNDAELNGGGIEIVRKNESDNSLFYFTLENVKLGQKGNPNSASNGGGGIYIQSTKKTELKLTNGTVIGSNDPSITTPADLAHCANYANYGGGFYINGNVSINNISSTISYNYAKTSGGGGCWDDNEDQSENTKTMGYNSSTSNTISYNCAEMYGGGIFVASNAKNFTFKNFNMYKNKASNGSEIYLDSKNTQTKEFFLDTVVIDSNTSTGETSAPLYLNAADVEIKNLNISTINATKNAIFIISNSIKIEGTLSRTTTIRLGGDGNIPAVLNDTMTASERGTYKLNLNFGSLKLNYHLIDVPSNTTLTKTNYNILNTNYTLLDDGYVIKKEIGPIGNGTTGKTINEVISEQKTIYNITKRIYLFFESDYTAQSTATGCQFLMNKDTQSNSYEYFVYGNGHTYNANRSAYSQYTASAIKVDNCIATIDNLTVIGGYYESGGGGLQIGGNTNTKVTLKNNTVIGDKNATTYPTSISAASNYGYAGGIVVSDDPTLIIENENVIIANNYGKNAGGIYSGAGSHLQVNNNTDSTGTLDIRYNYAEKNSGGIYCSDANLYFSGKIHNNYTADTHNLIAGAIKYVATNDRSLDIYNTQIYNNGINNDGSYRSSGITIATNVNTISKQSKGFSNLKITSSSDDKLLDIIIHKNSHTTSSNFHDKTFYYPDTYDVFSLFDFSNYFKSAFSYYPNPSETSIYKLILYKPKPTSKTDWNNNQNQRNPWE